MSKHVHWQSRWQLGLEDGLALHDGGLRVRLLEGVGIADNAIDIEQALAPEHGLHNASAMVRRLVREGAQLLVDPHSRGWRGGKVTDTDGRIDGAPLPPHTPSPDQEPSA
jgi:hypothetical protein